MPKLLLPLVALLAVGGSAAGAGVYLATRGETVEKVLPPAAVQASPTPTTAPTTIQASPTPTPTPALQTYRNEKYGYEVNYPAGWRLATAYMQKFADLTSNPRFTAVPEDYVVLTSLSENEEANFVQEAAQKPGGLTGLEPWYEFAPGESIYIQPVEIDMGAFITDQVQGNVIRTNTDVRQETLNSGLVVIRLTRREQDDRGDFIYDTVYVPFPLAACATFGNPCNGVTIRILRAGRTSLEDPAGKPLPEFPNYAREEFESILRSFREAK